MDFKPEFLTGELKRNLDSLCPDNEIISVKNKNFNDISTAIHEQISLCWKKNFSMILPILFIKNKITLPQ